MGMTVAESQVKSSERTKRVTTSTHANRLGGNQVDESGRQHVKDRDLKGKRVRMHDPEG